MIVIKYNKVRIDTAEDLFIHPIGDVHFGHMNCDVDGFANYLKSIPKAANHRIILMGDLADCGLKSSVGASAYEQSYIPDEQLDFLTDVFAPYSEQIDGCVMGNHEYRIFKESGIDILKQFSKQLHTPYFLYSGVVTYSLGMNGQERAYNINMFHGKSGGGVENALRACKAMANKVTADVYMMGHCHFNAYTTRLMKYIDSRNNKLVDLPQYFVLTGQMLKYDEGYADQANLEISPQGFPIITLSGSGKKDITIS